MFDLDVPHWARDASPFAYQKLPALDPAGVALAVLIAVAVVAAGVGLAAFRRRDLTSG